MDGLASFGLTSPKSTTTNKEKRGGNGRALVEEEGQPKEKKDLKGPQWRNPQRVPIWRKVSPLVGVEKKGGGEK